jgi:anti-anti-sigma factor
VVSRDIAEFEAPTGSEVSDLLRWYVTSVGDEVVVDIGGELDLANTTALGHALANIVAEQPSTVTLDLAQVTFMDSTGIHCLVDAARQAAAVGCRLSARNPGPAVLRVMEICGVDAILLNGSPEGPAARRR